MDEGKTPYLLGYFNQIEGQVVFGDSKASLLIAGDSILLAITGSFIKTVSKCPADNFSVDCMGISPPFVLAVVSAASLVAALAHALYAARPASIHANPPPELFLVSYLAHIDRATFLDVFKEATVADLERAALQAIHGKAEYATRKFRLLRRAVDATLVSLAFLVFAAILAIVPRLAG